MKTGTKILTTVAVAALIGGGVFAYKTYANEGRPGRQMLAQRLQELGVTQDQKDQVRAILQSHRPSAEPVIRQFVTERRALRDLMHAKNVDENAIRKQVAKLADVGADLAVERAKVAHELRGVLTPAQIEKLNDMKEDIDGRIDAFLDRASKRVAQ